MEPGKISNTESSKSSEDDPHQEYKAADQKPKEDDNMGVGRSYECVFCKRGFTNAQALGGHMNIHRKDKATKPKSKPRNEPAASLIHKVGCSRYFPGEAVSSQINHDNYKVYLPSPNPRSHTGNINRRMMVDFGPNERFGLTDDSDETLSLRIGQTSSTNPTIEEIGGEQNVKNNDEVDLELRLGHDP